jgi:hypothetical protein
MDGGAGLLRSVHVSALTYPQAKAKQEAERKAKEEADRKAKQEAEVSAAVVPLYCWCQRVCNWECHNDALVVTFDVVHQYTEIGYALHTPALGRQCMQYMFNVGPTATLSPETPCAAVVQASIQASSECIPQSANPFKPTCRWCWV